MASANDGEIYLPPAPPQEPPSSSSSGFEDFFHLVYIACVLVAFAQAAWFLFRTPRGREMLRRIRGLPSVLQGGVAAAGSVLQGGVMPPPQQQPQVATGATPAQPAQNQAVPVVVVAAVEVVAGVGYGGAQNVAYGGSAPVAYGGGGGGTQMPVVACTAVPMAAGAGGAAMPMSMPVAAPAATAVPVEKF